MKLIQALDEFYYDLILENLKAMNKDKVYGNLTYNSLLYVELILYTENCTASYLADKLNIARSAVTLKVNDLVSKGIVYKIPSKTDKRVSYLKVSPEVAEEYRQLDIPLNKAAEQIESEFTKEEINIFIKMLHVIKKQYREDQNHE